MTPALRWGLIVALTGGALATGLTVWQQHRIQRAVQLETLERGSDVVDSALNRLERSEMMLRGTRGFVMGAGPDKVTSADFRRYFESRDLAVELPGILGVGMIVRVPPENEVAYLQSVRDRGAPDFSIKQLTPHAGERRVIQLVEPVDSNRAAVGLDVASESMRLATTNAALTSGHAVITGPIRLVQSQPGSSMGLLMLLAVQPVNLGLKAPIAASPVFVYSPIQVDDLLIAGGLKSELVRLDIADITDPAKPIGLQMPAPASTQKALGQASLTRDVLGRQWRFEFHAQPALVRGLNLTPPPTVLLLGLLAAALAALLTTTIIRLRASRQETVVRNMGLTTMLDQASDAIIGMDLAGVVTFWNRGASRIFGHTREEAVGHPITALGAAPTQVAEDQLLIDNARQGQPTAPFETQRQHRSGALVDVEISGGPALDQRGQVVGVVKILRPIAERLDQVRGLRAYGEELAALVAERTQQLEQTSQDMRTVLDALPSLVGSWDRELRNRFANAAYSRYFGGDHLTMAGKSMTEVLGDTLYEANRPFIEAALRGEDQRFERELHLQDGSGIRHTLAHYIPQFQNGEVLGFYVLVHDVTDLKHAQARLAALVIQAQNAEQRFRVTFEAAPHANMMVDRQGRIALVNRQAEVLFGYNRTDLLGSAVGMLLPERARAGHGALIEQFFGEGDHRKMAEGRELVGLRRDGTEMPLEIALSPVETEDGLFTLAAISDISSRRLAESERERALTLMRNSIDAVGAGMAIYDTEDRLNFCTERYREMFPLAREVLVPGTPFETILRLSVQVYAPTNSGAVDEAWIRQRMRDHRVGGEWTRRLTDGRHIRIVEHLLPDGQLVSLRLDVTDLARATEAAEAASRAKSDFLANTSHEIRTPLNAILGLTYLLQRETLPSDPQRMVGQIQLAGRALLSLINDVLDLAKIEAGQFTIDDDAFALRPALQEAMDLHAASAQAKGLTLELLAAPDLPDVVLGDTQRLHQILQNLLGNAIKFTSAGTVSLKVEPADGAETLGFTVADTGIGVSPETLSRLFKPFAQADTGVSRQFGGTGLGLSIVAKLAEMMGGAAGARSTPGQGSEFWVTLKLPAVDAALLPAAPGRPTPVRVLVAEDDDVQRAALVRMATSLGWAVAQVPGGRSLVELAVESAQQGHPFEAVISDWDMPDLDGLTALSQLREALHEQPPPAAVIVSAHELDKLRAAEHVELADALLIKPVDASALFNAVNNAIGRNKGAQNRLLEASEISGGESIWLAGVRVLVVDDSSLNLEVAQRVLALEHAEAVCCSSGAAALTLLKETSPPFDIVLMDVQMPEMDGNQTVRQLRQQPGLKNLPVVALSAGVQPRERSAALAAGMNDFLSKPLDPPRLVRCVRRLVERARGATVPVLPRATRGTVETPTAINIHGIDDTAVSWPLRIDNDLYLSLLKRFLAEFETVTDTPMAELPQRLHKLRGSAQVVGAMAVAAAAGRLEVAAQRSGDPALETLKIELQQRLHSLTQAAAASLHAQADRMATADAQAQHSAARAPVALPPDEVTALVALMERQSLDVMPLLNRLEPALRTALSAEDFASLRDALDEFDFSRALALVRPLRSTRP